MANLLSRPAIDNDFYASGGEKTGHPIDPSTGEAEVIKQVMEEQPIDGVEGLSDIYLEQYAWNATGMKKLS
jgi:hypothetical protein